jgi:hypothetical protein
MGRSNGSDWLDRYSAGEYEAVWAEMLQLGEALVSAPAYEHARAVAEETMRRARANVELLIERLRAAGYEFQYPEAVHVRPTDAEIARLDTLESELGPLPLSLRTFYELVGTVDLTQSWDQLVQWWEERRQSASELEILGEFDPLVVEPLTLDGNEGAYRPNWFFIAPDECHKANYSGGENYHVALPDSAADFPIQGMSGIDELFVPYLRATLANGGFRGKIECEGENCWKVEPGLELTLTLAVGLTPM